jgi:GTP 3',8-cyclase
LQLEVMTFGRRCAAARETTSCAKAIVAVWTGRNDRYSEQRTAETAVRQKVEMSYIGG